MLRRIRSILENGDGRTVRDIYYARESLTMDKTLRDHTAVSGA